MLVLALLWTSCKSLAVLPNKAPVDKVDLKLLSKQMNKQHAKFNHLRGR